MNLIEQLRELADDEIMQGFTLSDSGETITIGSLVTEAADKLEQLQAALRQISAVRESIVAHQNVNWSAHIYPLVAILSQVGIEAEGNIEEMQERYCADDDRPNAHGGHPYDKLGLILEERGLDRENNPLLRGHCRCGHKVSDHNNVYGQRHCLVKDCDCKSLDIWRGESDG